MASEQQQQQRRQALGLDTCPPAVAGAAALPAAGAIAAAAAAAAAAGAALPAAPAPLVGSITSEANWECRRFEVAGLAVELRQDLKGSNALRPLDDDRPGAWDSGGSEPGAPPILTGEDLSRVGLVVWQAGFVLADLLLRRPPFGSWHGATVLDLGCGTGLVGILLALAGAEVTLSDQPHIVPLADANAQANLTPGLHRWRVRPYTWGKGDAASALLPPAVVPPPEATAAAGEQQAPKGAPPRSSAQLAGGPPSASLLTAPEPHQQPAASAAGASSGGSTTGSSCHGSFDVITAADVVYQPEAYDALAATLRALAAPHTLVFLAYKRRGLQEERLLQLLEQRGFAVQEVPETQLAEEYRGGTYRVQRCSRIE